MAIRCKMKFSQGRRLGETGMRDTENPRTAVMPPRDGGAATQQQWGRGEAKPDVTRFFQGPQRRGFELARAIRIFFELMSGFRALHFLGPCDGLRFRAIQARR